MRRVVSLARISCNYGLTPSSSRLILHSVRHNHVMEPVLSRNDEILINRGDFLGIKPTKIRPQRISTPENVIAQLGEQSSRNWRISGEKFMLGILLPLEAAVQKPNEFSEALQRSSDRFAPFMISLCGKVMSDVSNGNKIIILDRLWKVFENLAIPVSLDMFNAKLAVWLENNHEIDAKEVLNEMEMTFKLEPNTKTFNLLLKHLAFARKESNTEPWMYEMAKRGLVGNLETSCAKILCAATSRNHVETDELVAQTIDKYGPTARPATMGAALIGSAAAGDIARLRRLLRQAVIVSTDSEEGRNVLEIDYKDGFEIIWFLARNSEERDGKEYSALSDQILEHALRGKGFFKHLVRETERHVAHEFYYTATPILVDTLRVKDCLRNQRKNLFAVHMLQRICHQMIRSKLDIESIKEVSNRISASFGSGYRFYDSLIYAVVTYRDYSAFDKYEIFSAFIDVVDPERERIHLTLPLLTSCIGIQHRLKMLYRITKLFGYSDISHLDIEVLAKILIFPMIEVADDGTNSFRSRLDILVRVLSSYGVSPTVTWKVVFNWWNYRCSRNEGRSYENKEMHAWLQHNYTEMFEAPKETTVETPPNIETLKTFVRDGDYERVHSLLIKYGWPRDTDFHVIAPQILDLYLELADWGSTTRMLSMLSGACNRFLESENQAYPVKNHHLLNIMRRRLVEKPELEVSSIIDYAYELRRMFPNALSDYSTFFETIQASHRLFNSILFSPVHYEKNTELTVGRVDKIIDLLITLIKLDMINLHMNETLTSVIVSTVLNGLGWTAAVDTWLKFQSTLYLSNGMISLLKYSIGHSRNRAHTQYVLHKSKSFLSQSRANAIYLAALVDVKREDEAEEFLATEDHGIKPLDVVHVFRLVNAINYRDYNERFVVSFTRLCLQHTSLKDDSAACKIFHNDWLKMCENKRLGQLPLELYDLFKSFKQPLNREQTEKVRKLAEEHEKLTKKWIFGQSSLLNVTGETKRQYNDNFESRLRSLEEEVRSPRKYLTISEDDRKVQQTQLLENILNLQLVDELRNNRKDANKDVEFKLEEAV